MRADAAPVADRVAVLRARDRRAGSDPALVRYRFETPAWRRPGEGKVLRIIGFLRIAATALLASSLLGLASCEPLSAETGWEAERVEPLRLAEQPRDEVVAGESLELDFDQALDASSVGSLSVRLRRPGGRSVAGVRVAASGSQIRLHVPRDAAPGPVELELLGRPAPAALRAVTGGALPTTVRRELALVGTAALDVEAPVVLSSTPPDGSRDVASGRTVHLEFSEPIVRGPVRSGDALELLVDGAVVRKRLRLSADGLRVAIRPVRPVPPGSSVEVRVTSALLDRAGNPATPGSAVRFTTRSSSLHELSEEFLTREMEDSRATTSDWAADGRTGRLVAATRRLVLGPSRDSDGEVSSAGVTGPFRVQVLIPAHELPDGYASAVALRLRGYTDETGIPGRIRVGLTELEHLDPSFEGNLRATQVQYEHAGIAGMPLTRADGETLLEVPFELPVPALAGFGLLLDVEAVLPPGVAVGSVVPDAELSLDDDGAPASAPAVALMVTTGTPMARSRWYDSGFDRPDWRAAVIETSAGASARLHMEYQSAPADDDGRADPFAASDWETSPAHLPRFRFIRFRARFVGFDEQGQPDALERVVLPYVVR